MNHAMNNIDLANSERRYSEKAVMNLLGINLEGLRKMEEQGRLKLSRESGPVGYPACQVEALFRDSKGGK